MAGDDGPFTIALTDPGAPSRKRPKWSEMCHWVVTDEGSKRSPDETQNFDVESLKDIAECTYSVPLFKLKPYTLLPSSFHSR
jgi:phosphatidylethanolamine-binding protein (PEBP) family uncharacterized protein